MTGPSDLASSPILPTGAVSEAFLERGAQTFGDAMRLVSNLRYARNTDKDNPMTVLMEERGTCGTKHALLKQLADENNLMNVRLVTGLFAMNGRNTPAVAATLKKHGLSYLPEAHNYLKFHGTIIDCTTPYGLNFRNDLICELEIGPHQVGAYKVAWHRTQLLKWLGENPQISFSLDETWEIREQCIRDLAASSDSVNGTEIA